MEERRVGVMFFLDGWAILRGPREDGVVARRDGDRMLRAGAANLRFVGTGGGAVKMSPSMSGDIYRSLFGSVFVQVYV
jgi:hypothetical protein